MRVGIVGNYGHDNNGDEAILQGILHQLTVYMNIPKENIIVFSNNPANTKNRYGIQSFHLLKKKGNILVSGAVTLLEYRKQLKTLDYLIIGGGGILMDMYKRDAPLYSSIALVARLSGCKTIIYGAGAGPINTKLGSFLIKNMASSAQLVAVRDEKSKQLIKKLRIQQQVHVIADPAFTLKYSGKQELTDQPLSIGITAVPYFSKDYWPVSDEHVYTRYVEGMAKNIDCILKQLPAAAVHFYSTKFPQDIKVTEEIYDKMEIKERVTVHKENMYPEQLINMAGEMDLLIGTRLHSIILAVAAGTPVIGINYHEKVSSFMKKADISRLLAEIGQLEDERLLFHLLEKEMERGWKKLQLEQFDLSDRMREEALNGVTLLKSVME